MEKASKALQVGNNPEDFEGVGGDAGDVARSGAEGFGASYQDLEKPADSEPAERLSQPPYAGKGALLGVTGQLAATLLNATKKALYLAPLFKSNKEAGMSQREFNLWSKGLQEQDQANYEKALEAGKKEVQKRMTPEWEQHFMEKAREVESDLYSSPHIAAYRYFRLGELPTGEKVDAPKLDRDAVEYMTDKGALKAITKTDGVHPDSLAPNFGYASGKEMVEALNNIEKDRGKASPQQYLKQMVTELANQKLDNEYGSMEDAMLEEAQKIALENSQVDLIIEEMRILAKQTNSMPFSKAQIRDQVAEIFDRTLVREAKFATYQRATFKNGKDAELALLKGDTQAAFRSALKRIYSIMGAQESKRFERFQKGAEKQFDRLAKEPTLPNVDQQFVNHAHKILSDLGRAPARQPPAEALTDFVDNHIGVEIASWLYDPTTKRADMTLDNMTVEEYEGLAKSIKSLIHNGREWNLIGRIHDKADLDNIVFDIVQQLNEVGPNGKPRFPDIPLSDYPSLGSRVGSAARSINSMNLLVERMFDYIDRFNPNGPLTRYLDRPLRDSYNEELKLTEATVKKLKAAQAYTDASINDFIDNKVLKFRGEDRSLTRQNMRYLMLYMGSKSGMEKLVKGFEVKEDDLWDLVAKNATEKDIKWANTMWSLHEDLWTRGAAMELRVKGVEPDKIEAVPRNITLKDGSVYRLDGGYSPIRYDKNRSQHSLDLEKKQNAKLTNSGLFKNDYIQAVTPSKWVVPRTGYAAPLDLTGSMYASKLTAMIHDITFREAVINARKLLLNEQFRTEFTKKWGKEYNKLLDGWLSDIANSHTVNDDFAQGIAHGISVVRQQIVSAMTSGNISTIAKHGLSALAMSATQVGGKGIVKGIHDFGISGMAGALKDLVNDKSMGPDENFAAAMKLVTATTAEGEATRAFIYNSSPLMRARMRPYWDTIRGAFDRGTNVGGGLVPGGQTYANVREYMSHIGRLAIAMADFMSAGPEWLSAYKKEFLASGDHDQAINVADRAVSRAHGSSFIGDKPALLRHGDVNSVQGQVFRSMTALMQFWIHNYNNLIQMGWDTSQAVRGQDEPGARFFKGQKDQRYSDTNIPPISLRLVAIVIVPIIAEEMMTGWNSEDGRGFGTRLLMSTISYFGSFFPGVREVTNFLTHHGEPTFGLFGAMLHYMAQAKNAIQRIAEGKALPSNGMQYLIGTAGMLTPFGSIQSGRTIQGIHGALTGKETPANAIEFLRQFSTGHPRRRVVK